MRFALRSLIFGLFASGAAGQSGGGYDLTWSTIDSGGQMFSTGNGYELGGTIGQADAGALSGGAYELSGGFWSAACTCRLYGDLVEPFCEFQPDVDDLLWTVCAFANANDCPGADIFPCAPDPCTLDADCAGSVTGAVCIGGGCRCTGDGDCLAAGAECNVSRQGGRCELVDVDDLTALVQAYGGNYFCGHPCPP